MASQQRSPSLIAHGAAGATASVAAAALLYPLEQIRTLQQLGVAGRIATDKNRQRFGERIGCIVDCFETQGWQGIYRGISPSLFALGVSNFIFYFIFQGLKKLLSAIKLYIQLKASRAKWSKVGGNNGGGFSGQKSIEDLLTSMMAGVINVILTNPFWVAVIMMKKQQDIMRTSDSEQENTETTPTSDLSSSSSAKIEETAATRVEADKRYEGITGMFHLLRDLSQTEGYGSLWKGCSASLVLVSNPIIHFAFYEGLKRMTLARSNKSTRFCQIMSTSRSGVVMAHAAHNTTLSPLQGFVIGGVAKTVATVLTYPLQVAQVKLRGESSEASKQGGGKVLAKEQAVVTSNNHELDTNTEVETEVGAEAVNTGMASADDYVKRRNAFHVIEELWEKEGMNGIFQGLESKIIQSALTSAFIFGSYEAILGFFNRFSPNRR